MNRKPMKIMALVLALVLALTMAACGSSASSKGEAAPQQTQPQATEPKPQTQLERTGNWLLGKVTEPTLGAVGGDWTVLGLARSGLALPEDYLQGYYRRVCQVVAEKNGILHDRKYTEYARAVLAITAAGEDPRNVEGFDLLLPLGDFDSTVFQGINGAAYALLALDCGGYDLPENSAAEVQATREGYLACLLEAQSEEGGWSVAGGGIQPDVTAMVLQALAKYTDDSQVAQAVEKALTALSGLQGSDGNFGDAGSSETTAQVIVALAELGISPNDPRFVKEGKTVLDGLMVFANEDGGFAHLAGNSSDQMATEQAFYALVALDRLERGAASLYSMTQE